MRKFDEACLTPVRPLAAAEIKALREREGASQGMFTRYLNVTPSFVSLCERGEKRPQGASLKLLSLIAKNGLMMVESSQNRQTIASWAKLLVQRASSRHGGPVSAQLRPKSTSANRRKGA